MTRLQFSLSSRERRQRWFWIGLSGIPVVGSLLSAHSGYSSPLLCPIRAMTGIPCPGCGLTRSFTAIAMGDLSRAVDYHLFGPALGLICCYLLLQSLYEIWCNRAVYPVFLRRLCRPGPMLVGAGLVFGYHLIRLQSLAARGELGPAFQASPLGHFLSGGI